MDDQTSHAAPLRFAREALIAGDQPARIHDLARRITQMHSYEVPEIIATPILEGHPAYLNWMEEATALPCK